MLSRAALCTMNDRYETRCLLLTVKLGSEKGLFKPEKNIGLTT